MKWGYFLDQLNDLKPPAKAVYVLKEFLILKGSNADQAGRYDGFCNKVIIINSSDDAN